MADTDTDLLALADLARQATLAEVLAALQAGLPVDTGLDLAPIAREATLANVLAKLQAGLAVHTGLAQPLTRDQLDAARVATAPDYAPDPLLLDDQPGANDVLAFDFPAPVALVWIRSVGGVSRAGTADALPTPTRGAYCADDEPHPFTTTSRNVRVWAPAGATVSVWGWAR